MLVLDAATGPVTLTGDPATVADVGVAMAVSLATSPWGRDLTVGVHGLPADVLALAPERFEPVDDAAAVTAALAEAVEQRHAGDGVLSGGARREGGRLLVLATDPGREALAPLLTAGGRQASGVLVAAEVPGATWRLHVDEAGTVDIAPLDLRVTGYRLDEPTVSALASLLTAARDEPAAPVPTGTRFTVPPVDAMVDDATWLAAPNRIDLLGAPQARATGALDPSRIPLATEVVAFLAVHREGVHPTVLGGALWPRGVTPDVRDATVARVRDWLGDDERGGALLREPARRAAACRATCPPTGTSSAPWRCAPATSATRPRRPTCCVVPCGWCADRCSPGRRRVATGWVVRTRLERTVPEPGGGAGAPDGRACCTTTTRRVRSPPPPRGCAWRRASSLLWRDVLRAAHARDLTDPSGGAALLPAAVHRLRSVLADLDVPLESETEALIEEPRAGPARARGVARRPLRCGARVLHQPRSTPHRPLGRRRARPAEHQHRGGHEPPEQQQPPRCLHQAARDRLCRAVVGHQGRQSGEQWDAPAEVAERGDAQQADGREHEQQAQQRSDRLADAGQGRQQGDDAECGAAEHAHHAQAVLPRQRRLEVGERRVRGQHHDRGHEGGQQRHRHPVLHQRDRDRVLPPEPGRQRHSGGRRGCEGQRCATSRAFMAVRQPSRGDRSTALRTPPSPPPVLAGPPARPARA
nr:hypothetical protein [Angustibacter aerolatus]